MTSSGENWILSRIAELCTRVGVNPVTADFDLEFRCPPDDPVYWEMVNSSGDMLTPEEVQKTTTVCSLLGMELYGVRGFQSLEELKEVVEAAMAKVPRARTR